MMLAIDAGNSRIKWGLRAGGGWSARGSLGHGEIESLDAALPATIEHVIVANVAGQTLASRLEQLLSRRARSLEWLLASASRCGVRNGYRDPAQLGVDRWAALIGAWHMVGGRCLVVMAGTATTVDLLDDAGRFCGGLILPGLLLMRQSLASGTARLGLPDGRYAALPDCTANAIYSGCVNAQIGAIERMYRGLGEAPLLLAGGAAEALAEHLPQAPLRRSDDLVLEGLARIGEG